MNLFESLLLVTSFFEEVKEALKEGDDGMGNPEILVEGLTDVFEEDESRFIDREEEESNIQIRN